MTWNRWSPVDDPGEMRRVGESLESVARQLGLGSPSLIASVFGDWSAVVGPVLAAHSRPERLHEGELTISVDEPAWATEVRFLSGDIITRVNERINERVNERVNERNRTRRAAPGRGVAGTGSEGSEPSNQSISSVAVVVRRSGRAVDRSGSTTSNPRGRGGTKPDGKAAPGNQQTGPQSTRRDPC
jgi:hypothetical protein